MDAKHRADSEVMKDGDVEVLYIDGTWRVRIQGEGLVLRGYDAMYKAVTAGRAEAKHRGVDLVIKN